AAVLVAAHRTPRGHRAERVEHLGGADVARVHDEIRPRQRAERLGSHETVGVGDHTDAWHRRASVGYHGRPMLQRTRDLRIDSFRPLLPPAILLEELPLSERGSATVSRRRAAVSRGLNAADDRLVIVVGPCSIHDPVAAIDYARRPK